jgi:hypothetical protein
MNKPWESLRMLWPGPGEDSSGDPVYFCYGHVSFADMCTLIGTLDEYGESPELADEYCFSHVFLTETDGYWKLVSNKYEGAVAATMAATWLPRIQGKGAAA